MLRTLPALNANVAFFAFIIDIACVSCDRILYARRKRCLSLRALCALHVLRVLRALLAVQKVLKLRTTRSNLNIVTFSRTIRTALS